MTEDLTSCKRIERSLPRRAGLGLKPQHYRSIIEARPDVGFFEIHAENYMGAGGPPHRYLEAIRRDYPLSLHGVGLNLGGAAPLDDDHLTRLRVLIDRYEPGLFSEHLAWTSTGTNFLNDLLPIPYTEATLIHLCRRITEVQERLNRQILIENPATYMRYLESTISESEFLALLAEKTGCGLLLDLNNLYVSAVNHRFDATQYLGAIPLCEVRELHLAGHSEDDDSAGGRLLIDAHNSRICADVWALYRDVLEACGPLPTLIEWDNDVPDFQTLLAEARYSDSILNSIPHVAEVSTRVAVVA